MALIQNANNFITKSINEGASLSKAALTGGLGAVAQKFAKDVAVGAITPGGYMNPLGLSSSDLPSGGSGTTNVPNPQNTVAPSSLAAAAKSMSGGGTTSNQKALDNIGKGGDDTGDSIKAAEKNVGSMKDAISNLGKVKDQYLKANDTYQAKTNDAIAGNKELINKNQQKDLNTLAADTRKSADSTNIMLGVKGASGGSASIAAGNAIAAAAGKTRAATLTSYGDEFSKQNQAAQDATDAYNLRVQQADQWESEARQQAMIDYQNAEDAIKRLKNKSGDWKASDLKAESSKNLDNLMSSLNNINTTASNFRTNLSAKYEEYGGKADELNSAAVTVDAPAELQTPDFSASYDYTDPNNATDFFDPNATGKTRVIKGYDALGNPIYQDELAAATA